MTELPEHPATTLLRSFSVEEHATVSLQRVVRQRAAFAELYDAAMLQPSLDVLLETSCRVAAEACDAPLAKVLRHLPQEKQFIVRAGFGWNPGVVGHARASDKPDNPAGESLRSRRPVAVRDVRQRQDYHLPPIYPEHHIVSSTNVPVIGVSGFYGVLEVDRREERPFDALDSTFLISVAGIVADAVERVRREAALQAAHDARAVLLREHHHRVRNNYQTLVARLQRHARQATTEDARHRFKDVERRVFTLAALYDHLLGMGLPEGPIDFSRYLADLCERMRTFYGVEEHAIELTCGCDDIGVTFDPDTCTAIATVVNELVANAVEHAFGEAGGRIDIRLQRGAEGPVLTVFDNGSGLPSTRPESIGLAVARDLLSGVGGSMSVTANGGTTWTINLPPR